MKKNYLKPEMEVVEIKFESDLMAASGSGGDIIVNPDEGDHGAPDDSKEHNLSNNIWD